MEFKWVEENEHVTMGMTKLTFLFRGYELELPIDFSGKEVETNTRMPKLI